MKPKTVARGIVVGMIMVTGILLVMIGVLLSQIIDINAVLPLIAIGLVVRVVEEWYLSELKKQSTVTV